MVEKYIGKRGRERREREQNGVKLWEKSILSEDGHGFLVYLFVPRTSSCYLFLFLEMAVISNTGVKVNFLERYKLSTSPPLGYRVANSAKDQTKIIADDSDRINRWNEI